MSGDRIRLEVKQRNEHELGSRNSRRLRKQGLIPGVLYGKGHSRPIVVGERDLRAVLTGSSGLHAILDVVIEGQKTAHPSVLKEYQQHPIRGRLTHVDLHEVRLDQPIHASLAVQLAGDSPGLRAGGVLNQVTRELNVEALPGAIPEHIEIDLSGLDVGDVLRLEDVPPIEGVEFLDDPHETVIATIMTPRGYEVEEEVPEVEGEAVPEAAAEAAPEAAEAAEPASDEG